MASVLGFRRSCRLATDPVPLASSLYFLQGTFEKIQLQGFLGQHSLEPANLFAERGFTRVLRRRFIADACPGPIARATCIGAADESPALPPALRCCRNLAVARPPFDGTQSDTVSLFSFPLAVPFPAKCPLFECLMGRVQSIPARRQYGWRVSSAPVCGNLISRTSLRSRLSHPPG